MSCVTLPPCVPGTETTTYFAVQPAVDQCPVIVRQVSTVVDEACNRTVAYFQGDTTLPYTGPLEPRVKIPDFVRVCGSLTVSQPLQIEFASQWFYDASTNAKYERLRRYDESTGIWVVEWYDFNGNPISAPPEANLRSTAQFDVEYVVEPGCANGVPYSRVMTLVHDAETGALNNFSFEWVNSAGAFSPTAPTGWQLGACPQPRIIEGRRVVAHTNPGVITSAGIIALVPGATRLHAVTVAQVSGTGSLAGDGGSGVTLIEGMAVNISSLEGDSLAELTPAALIINSGGGVQNIVAVVS